MATLHTSEDPGRSRYTATDLDVLIVGAGISGIGVACHLAMNQPGRSFAIVDSREAIGGTWDLFRYPGIRSDSDLHTFGFEFKPWTKTNAIANGDEILDYLAQAVEEYGLGDKLHLGHKVVRADFSSISGRWTVEIERLSDGHRSKLTCAWLFSAAGYYDHAAGNAPDFPGEDDFTGSIIHPQTWPEDLAYADKNVVVIGSGATALTLVPALAEQTRHVTMLQRTPTYVLSLPRQDPVANALNRLLPDRLAYRITRGINVRSRWLMFSLSQRHPGAVRRVLRQLTKRLLPKGYDVDTHFNPPYGPWDQRLCQVPDADLFQAISTGAASVVTDKIDRFTPSGILLDSGQELEADIIVTATGLQLLAFGGMELSVDGSPITLSDTVAYKAFMLSGVPNFAFAIGYTNSSWTLKVDLVAEHLCRVLAHMDRQGYDVAVPAEPSPAVSRRPFFDFAAGYIQRSIHLFPRQGSSGPWTMPQAYAEDRRRLRHGAVEDPNLHFRSLSLDVVNEAADRVPA